METDYILDYLGVVPAFLPATLAAVDLFQLCYSVQQLERYMLGRFKCERQQI